MKFHRSRENFASVNPEKSTNLFPLFRGGAIDARVLSASARKRRKTYLKPPIEFEILRSVGIIWIEFDSFCDFALRFDNCYGVCAREVVDSPLFGAGQFVASIATCVRNAFESF